MMRIGWTLACALCLALAAPDAQAQARYPSKPVKILVPYAAGGLTDVVARLFAEQLRQLLPGAVVVENKPGASGIVAIEEMARARPDGHTLLIGNISTNGLTPVLLAKKMKIDYDKDVQIVARLADAPVFFLATTSDFPPKTFAEFLQYAKERPGKVRYGSAGGGADAAAVEAHQDHRPLRARRPDRRGCPPLFRAVAAEPRARRLCRKQARRLRHRRDRGDGARQG